MKHIDQRGFSLLELLVSAAVMSIIILSIYGFFGQVREINRYANNLVIANQLLQQQLEVYRNTPYASLPTGSHNLAGILSPYPSLQTPRSATAVITELETDGLKQIDLTVSYTDKGGLKTTTASTLISSRGINK